jgi:hypothetical protein
MTAKATKGSKETPPKELSMEHERFCFFLSRGYPKVKAYQKVYPNSSYNAAHVSAYHLLQNPTIIDRLGILNAEQDEELRTTELDIKRDLARLKNYNAQDVYREDGLIKPLHEWDPNLAYCVKSVKYEQITAKDGGNLGMTTEVTFHDKVKPLELLGKTHKMFTDKTDVNHTGTIVTKIERTVVRPE